MKKILGLSGDDEELPKEFIIAYNNAKKLETTTILIKKGGWPKIKKRLQRTSRRITFGDVTLVDPIKRSRNTMPISDKKESRKTGTVKSALFIEKYILQLVIYIKPKDWEKCRLPCSTKESLLQHLAKENLDLSTFSADWCKIYTDFLKYNSSILGYKDSWIFKNLQTKLVRRRNLSGDIAWVDTGRKVDVTSSVKMYLLKILKAEHIASIIIQKNWRRKRTQIELALRNKFLAIEKILLNCAYIATPPEAREKFCRDNPNFIPNYFSPELTTASEAQNLEESDDEEDLYS